MRYGGGGLGVIIGVIFSFSFHVSEHIDHFKEIKKSPRKKQKYFRFFHLKSSLTFSVVKNLQPAILNSKSFPEQWVSFYCPGRNYAETEEQFMFLPYH